MPGIKKSLHGDDPRDVAAAPPDDDDVEGHRFRGGFTPDDGQEGSHPATRARDGDQSSDAGVDDR